MSTDSLTNENQRAPRLPKSRPGPAGGKRDINRRRQIAGICRAALSLFCARGVASVTVDEIVKEASIAKGSFYRYFKDKTELVATLLAPVGDAMREVLKNATIGVESTDCPEELTQIYMVLAAETTRVLMPHPDILRLYLQENRSPAVGAREAIVTLRKDLETAAYQLSLVAQQHGLLANDYHCRLGTLSSIGAIERLLLAALDGDDVGDISTGLVRVVLDGVRARS